MTVLNVALLTRTLMPSVDQVAFSAAAMLGIGAVVATRYVKVSFAPFLMPAPQSLAPEPAFWQVSVPPGTTFQPWAFKSALPLAGLKAKGLCFSVESRYGFL